MSAGALFLGKRLGLFEGFKALSSLKAWGMIGLTYLGIYIVTRIGSIVMMMEGVSNSTNQAAIENAHMNPSPSHNVYSNYGTDCGRAGFSRAPHGTRL